VVAVAFALCVSAIVFTLFVAALILFIVVVLINSSGFVECESEQPID
jgi:hypothetical protein